MMDQTTERENARRETVGHHRCIHQNLYFIHIQDNKSQLSNGLVWA